MGACCPCFFSQEKKKIAYDVHEQTFQLDEHIGQLDHPPKTEDNRQNNTNILSEIQNMDDEPFNDKLRPQENLLGKYKSLDEDRNNLTDKKQLVDNFNSKKEEKEDHNYRSIGEDKNNQSYEENINLSPKQLESEESQVQNDKKLYTSADRLESEPEAPRTIQPKVEVEIKPIKKKYNPDDYRFYQLNEAMQVKNIDSIKEQQFNIDNCHNSTLFVFDITANIYIDDCTNSKIFLAPCSGTIFIRNCKNIKMIAACQQFRTVQCYNCQFSLFCQSQPVIQSSSNLTFSTFQCKVYYELRKQFQQAKLQIWNNHWSQIHDFTQKEQKHYQLSKNATFVNEINWQQAFEDAKLKIANDDQLIPFIKGDYKPEDDKSYSNTAIIILNSEKSKTVQQINDVFKDVKQLQVLKAHYNKNIKQNAKQHRLALLINYQDDDILDEIYQFGEVIKDDEEQIRNALKKHFITFGDER